MSTRTCIVRSCTMKGTLRLPEDEARRKLWLQAIPIKPWLLIGKYSRICSAHFSPTDFARTPLSLLQSDIVPKTLKKTAIPSVFVKKTDFSSEYCLKVTEVKNTYARTAPILFVEEPLYISYEKDLSEDPLQLSNEVDYQCAHTSQENDDQCAHTFIDLKILACQSDHDTDDMIAEELEIPTQEENKFCHKAIGIEQAVQTENIHVCKYSMNFYKSNDKAVHFYTGLETFNKFGYVMNTLGPSAHKLKYYYGPPPKKLDSLECFFITLLILRRHKPFEEIAMDYQITKKQVTNIFITWVRFMSLQWNNLDLWISKDLIREYMPSDFYDKYPSTSVILDATEFPIK